MGEVNVVYACFLESGHCRGGSVKEGHRAYAMNLLLNVEAQVLDEFLREFWQVAAFDEEGRQS